MFREATSRSIALLAILIAGAPAPSAPAAPAVAPPTIPGGPGSAADPAEPCAIGGAPRGGGGVDGRVDPAGSPDRRADAAEAVAPEDRDPADDEALARRACETARARFAELFGDPVPAVRIVLWDRPGYRTGLQGERAAVVWPTSRVMAGRAKSAEAAVPYAASQWNDVLPHEISHALLAARFFAEERADRPAGYGTPLPDWLDEGVAIWAETPENRRARLAQARTLPAERRDLITILERVHPAAGATAAAMRDGAAPPPDEALWAFYPQSIAALSFVFDAGGPDALAALVRRLLEEPAGAASPDGPASPDTRGARSLLAGLPGLPGDFEGVVAAWNAWLAAGGSQSTAASP